MDVKFYIKRNINNQVAKITKDNITFLDNNFKLGTNEEDLFSLIRSTDETKLGDFFQHSRFGKLPLSAKFTKKFTLCSLYKVEILSKEEFYKLQQKEKFEFIITQRTVAWINLLDKSELVNFLKFCNIYCEDSNTIVELRNLASSAIKSFRREDTDVIEIEEDLSLNFNNSGDNWANETFIEKDTETDNVDTLSIGYKIKNLLDDLRLTNETENQHNNSNLNKADILNQTSDINLKSNNINSEVENNKVTSEIRENLKNTVEKSTVEIKPKIIINKNKLNIKSNMALKSMLHQPQPFSGSSHEDVDNFFDNFDLAAIINEWGEYEKITLLPLYLKDTAGKFFKIIKTKNPNITWESVKTQLIEKFTVIGNKKLLKIQLDQRKLEKGETISEFLINIIELCNKIDLQMEETDICEKILAGLPDEIYDKIDILDNSTLNNLEKNLKHVESSKLIRNKNINSNREVEELRKEMDVLKNHIKNLNTTQSGQNNFNRNSYTRNQNNRNFKDDNFNNYNNRYVSNNNQRFNNNNNFNNNGNSNGPQNFNYNNYKNRNFQRNHDHYGNNGNNNKNNVDRNFNNTNSRNNNNFDNSQYNKSYYYLNQNRLNNYFTNNSNRNNDFNKNNTFSGRRNNANPEYNNSNNYGGESGYNRQNVRVEEVNTNFVEKNSRSNSMNSNKNVPNQKN